MTRSSSFAAAAVAFTLLAGGGAARAEEMTTPQTAADHLTMAKRYEEKVAAWKAEAAYHRDMAAAYRREHPDRKSGARNPYTVEMEKHCMTIVKDVEKLVVDAEWAARYHQQRALELGGK